MALFAAAVGGALLMQPGGIDFALLKPRLLAVAMFIALPALYGLSMSALADRFLSEREGGPHFTGWVASLAGYHHVVPMVAPDERPRRRKHGGRDKQFHRPAQDEGINAKSWLFSLEVIVEARLMTATGMPLMLATSGDPCAR